MCSEVSDWRTLLKERWGVITGRNIKRYLPKLEKLFNVFLISAFCGYLIPLFFIFHNLVVFKEGEAEQKDTVWNPISAAPSWLEICYCLALSVFLGVCIFMYLIRRLRRDFLRYRNYYDDEDNEEPEYGWKLVHGDVYATPENPDFIAAIIGIGNGLMVTHCVLYIPQVPWVLWFKTPLIDLNLYFQFLGSVAPTVSVVFASKHFNTIKRVSGSYWLVFVTQWLFSVPLLIMLELMSRPSAFTPLFTDVNIPGILFAWLIGLLASGAVGKVAKPQQWSPPVRTNRIRRHIPEFGYQSTNLHAVAVAVVASCVIGYLTKFEFSWIFSADSFLKFLPAMVTVGFAIGTFTLVLMDRQLNRENYWWRWSALFSGGCFPFVVLCFWIMWNWQHVTLDEVIGWTILAAALAAQMGAASYDGADWWLSRLYSSIMID